MRYWWVNQNQTYRAEVPGGFLWSPKTRADGARNQFYENMRLIEPGDVIFSFCNTYIKAVGVAIDRAATAPKPDFGRAGEAWSQEGWLVPVEFKELGSPVRPKDHIQELRPHLPEKYSPLQSNGDGLQSVYLARVPEALASALIHLLGEQYGATKDELTDEVGGTAAEDSQEGLIRGRTDIGSTAKEQLVRARRGQGIFRANVRLNEKVCRITRVSSPTFLIASHIKPWKDSSDEEKLNGCNGLFLAPHVDLLFDKGLISFTNSGDLLISPHLDQQILEAWGISSDLNVGPFSDEQTHFLEYHRTKVFRR
jgi:putative restriction endonuclease